MIQQPSSRPLSAAISAAAFIPLRAGTMTSMIPTDRIGTRGTSAMSGSRYTGGLVPGVGLKLGSEEWNADFTLLPQLASEMMVTIVTSARGAADRTIRRMREP